MVEQFSAELVQNQLFLHLIERAMAKSARGTRANVHLKVADYEGESQHKGHEKEIEVLAYEWGVTQRGTAGSGGGAGGGKSRWYDLKVVAKVNKATPKIHLATASGTHVKEGTLTVTKAGDSPQDYLTVKLGSFIFSESLVVDTTDDDQIPLHCFAMNFATFDKEYKEQKADGSLGASTKMGWDLAANTKK
jgi:type VI secretion system secreted protein Hcp